MMMMMMMIMMMMMMMMMMVHVGSNHMLSAIASDSDAGIK